jgi:putative membrane protein
MAFIDFLAFQEATLIFATVLIGYVGVIAFFAMRHNDAAGVKSALRGGAVPIGSLGVIATALGVWAEEAWPLPGSYNILFTDVYLLFGLTLVVLAVSMAANLKLQYAGLFALVAGGVTMSYGWNGYILHMTKDPLETFLMYGAFGLAGILAFPATVITDHYLAHPDGTAFHFGIGSASPRSRPSIQASSRAVQPIVPTTASAAAATPDVEASVAPKFRLPVYVNVAVIVFVISIALASVAAILYLNSTLPGHLISAP